jgi:hypothetical protein
VNAQVLGVDAGLAVPMHRLALAVLPIDAATGQRTDRGLRIGRETARSVESALRIGRRGGQASPAVSIPGGDGSGVVILHRLTESAKAVVRIQDGRRRWVPRRIEIPLWSHADVEASDELVDLHTGVITAPHGPFVPPDSRVLAPWLLPGAAYPAPAATTGVRMRILRGGKPVRWARVEAFTGAGTRIGWAHGDERGEALLLCTEMAAFPAPGSTDTIPLALRVHSRNAPFTAAVQAMLDAGDPLADLPLERFPRRPIVPPGGAASDLVAGITRPSGYGTAPDHVVVIDIGRITTIPELNV